MAMDKIGKSHDDNDMMMMMMMMIMIFDYHEGDDHSHDSFVILYYTIKNFKINIS